MLHPLSDPAHHVEQTDPSDEDVKNFIVRIPDPLECVPPRAKAGGGQFRLHPLYGDSVIAAGPVTTGDPMRYPGVRVASVEPRCMVTFIRKQASFAGCSTKTRRMMSGLGPHELAVWRELEVNPHWVDFDLQRIRTSWADDDAIRSYLSDYIAVDQHMCVTRSVLPVGLSDVEDVEADGLLLVVEAAHQVIF